MDLFEPQATVGDEAEDSETGNCQASGDLIDTIDIEGDASDKETRK